MKNIHVLPTDKPSRLYFYKGDDKYPTQYGLRSLKSLPFKDSFTNHNIYITSDEEIKEGDWCFLDQPLENGFPNHQEVFQNKDDSDYLNMVNHLVKKIILTDNKDLIKDGVQAIDDDFLKWFVKNPSCEEINIEKDYSYGNLEHFDYKIIIPKEEPKQKCKDCNDNLTDCTCIEDTIDMKQEALEELGKTISIKDAKKDSFEDVTKYKIERSYSEGEVLELFQKYISTQIPLARLRKILNREFNEWFNKFKKK